MKPSYKNQLSNSQRRELLLDRIALGRIELRRSAQALLKPAHVLDQVREKVALNRHWLYPFAPTLLFLLLRLRPSLKASLRLGTRAFTVWQLYRRIVARRSA